MTAVTRFEMSAERRKQTNCIRQLVRGIKGKSTPGSYFLLGSVHNFGNHHHGESTMYFTQGFSCFRRSNPPNHHRGALMDRNGCFASDFPEDIAVLLGCAGPEGSGLLQCRRHVPTRPRPRSQDRPRLEELQGVWRLHRGMRQAVPKMILQIGGSISFAPEPGY